MNSARLARRWQESGGDYARMAEALNDEITEELATKTDLHALEGALKAELAELTTEIAEVRRQLGTEIAGIRTEIAEVRRELGTEIAGIRTETAEARRELGTEIAATRGHLDAKIESVRAELVKWVGGIAAVQVLAIVGLVRFLFVE